ncbi:YeeE/YedE family protein [Vibrio fortis]|uniref:YeeE/YedE family protein n=1 Tax=Vibrio fortis TaxID=212667 RepID=UPI0021C44273|nr:YeeE/YedE family protein [Vibrio fortis]
MPPVSLFVALLSGVLFGAGMNVSGMVDPANIFAFLDITGEWDPSLAFVMGGALLVFTPFYHFIIKPCSKTVDGNAFSLPTNTKIDHKLILGASIFGLGWGIGGICPGPAVASLGEGSITIILFIASMMIGMKSVTLFARK